MAENATGGPLASFPGLEDTAPALEPTQLTFPGLEPAGGQAFTTPLELAAMETLRELREQGLLRREHSLTVQLVLELARAVGRGVASGRASAVAMAAKQLTEAMALLPAPSSEDVPLESSDWRAFLATAEAAEAAEAAARGAA